MKIEELIEKDVCKELKEWGLELSFIESIEPYDILRNFMRSHKDCIKYYITAYAKFKSSYTIDYNIQHKVYCVWYAGIVDYYGQSSGKYYAN